ncbi:MAG: M1 family metallopeptidase [Leeuwenhoekiella sp.]
MKNKILIAFILVCSSTILSAQNIKKFTHADTLRGSINKERSWWDVLRYDMTIKPDYKTKTTVGKNKITYKTIAENHTDFMQIDLQKPLQIDSILDDAHRKLTFKQEGNAWHVKTVKSTNKDSSSVTIFFHGKPVEGVRPPWDGGWTFTKDSLNRPWMTVTCQGLGASVWYPNKDHQSDEPDHGASLTIIVPSELTAVANGRLQNKVENNDGTTSFTWEVKNPINNYDIIPYIGYYKNFSEKYLGLKGELDLNYWVLDYNLEKAKAYLPKEVHNMLNSFEYWFGPYPFYEDGYKLVETEHTGMEHQSAVAYGNHYSPGYRGRDASGTGLGMKWDFIVVHESGHEWFGNNITSNDLADMYIHEGFTNYSETLFVDYIYGTEAANDYNYGIRGGIKNDKPVIAPYGVNAQGSGDMYPKGGNMLHSIRHSINNDKLFRNILAGLNQTFYHQTVTSKQIQDYISAKAGFDYTQVFYQYLNTIQVPKLELFTDRQSDKIFYRYTNCVVGFDLPLSLLGDHTSLKITPNNKWQSVAVTPEQQVLFDPIRIEKMYYIEVEQIASMNEK